MPLKRTPPTTPSTAVASQSDTDIPRSVDEDALNVTTRHKRARTDCSPPTINVTRSEMQNLIREEMRLVMKEFMADMRRTLNSQLQELRDQLTEYKDSLNFLSAQYDTLKDDVSTTCLEINKIKTENESLRSEVLTLSSRVRQMDQLSRSANLELQCVPEHRAENLVSVVKQLGRVVKCPIEDRDICYSSRVAKSNPNSSRPRTILVKLSTPRTRDSLLAATIQYNKDHPNEKLNTSILGLDDKKTAVYVSENLTTENKNLHAAARLRAKQLNYKFVWVRGGRVYVRKQQESQSVFVRDIDVLNKLK